MECQTFKMHLLLGLNYEYLNFEFDGIQKQEFAISQQKR